MHTQGKPGSVVAVLVLLVLIAVYQLFIGATTLFGAFVVEGTDLMEQMPTEMDAVAETAEQNVWAIYLGGAVCLVYAVAATVLAVMVGRGEPRARPLTIGVNAVFGVANPALMIPMVYGPGAVISAVFALVVAGLLFRRAAQDYFSAPAGETVRS
ncbi:hypothetical protein GCM10007079_44430 [Nocardiopsis terrae]|uniref:Membrane protein n=1 Tax=Nocardiopsis terrae TaxID=372655 RepID=A0ABR9HL33_9ACTN|nr:hypothetical protein [Nocardiopsis terrae]MBE1459744.1 putative membrane protein [Nocardiopsis terrae]GHC94193.1 hypothetical protein GCM10007079_44430 [Nocardiopsis terrae]